MGMDGRTGMHRRDFVKDLLSCLGMVKEEAASMTFATAFKDLTFGKRISVRSLVLVAMPDANSRRYCTAGQYCLNSSATGLRLRRNFHVFFEHLSAGREQSFV